MWNVHRYRRNPLIQSIENGGKRKRILYRYSGVTSGTVVIENRLH